jgi:hypothetical protein
MLSVVQAAAEKTTNGWDVLSVVAILGFFAFLNYLIWR